MTYKQEVGQRLRDFAVKDSGSIARFAKKLKMRPESLYDYLNGETLPGDRFRDKLEKAGCNAVWLLTGKYPDAERQKKEIAMEVEGKKILDYLRTIGLDTLEKVQQTLRPMLHAAEKMEEFKPKK
jgi:transcriptional regulator with XRE-family HTH domain